MTRFFNTWLANRHARQLLRARQTPEERRAQRVQQLIGAILIFVAIVMLMEVVIAPGSMIRHHLNSASADLSDAAQTGAENRSALFLIQQRHLEALCRDIDAEWMSLRRDTANRLGVDLAFLDQESLPPSVGKDPKAAQAWAEIKAIAPAIDRQLSDAKDTALATAVRVSNGAALGNDEIAVSNAIDQLSVVQTLLRRLHVAIDHVEFSSRSAIRPASAK